MKYKILLRPSEEGYSIAVSGLAGCWPQVATDEDIIENIRDAIQESI
ncbi:MAG: type II toxin-antitoxin system HicB family antitoxin [Desulfomonilaceae bacterium]